MFPYQLIFFHWTSLSTINDHRFIISFSYKIIINFLPLPLGLLFLILLKLFFLKYVGPKLFSNPFSFLILFSYFFFLWSTSARCILIYFALSKCFFPFPLFLLTSPAHFSGNSILYKWNITFLSFSYPWILIRFQAFVLFLRDDLSDQGHTAYLQAEKIVPFRISRVQDKWTTRDTLWFQVLLDHFFLQSFIDSFLCNFVHR